MTPTTEELVAELRREIGRSEFVRAAAVVDGHSIDLADYARLAEATKRAIEALTPKVDPPADLGPLVRDWQSRAPKVGDREPQAWSYELATYIGSNDLKYDGWVACLTREKPCVSEGAIRNLTPLFARLTTPAEARLREALTGAFVTTISQGNPDPEERFANVTLEFRGPDALERANDLYDALATIARRALSDGMEGGGE